MAKQDKAAQSVEMDKELEMGAFRVGARYHIRTPTYQYLGTLTGITETVFVFEDTATVYLTGDYREFYAGRGADVQAHVGAGEMVVDRAGTVLHRMLNENR